MTEPDITNPHKRLNARRVALLASVAGISAALLAAGPGGFGPSGFPAWAAARAAPVLETPSHVTGAPEHPASFAGLVAKVRPAVISVRVKMTANAEAANASQNEQILPFQPGSPLEKFFRQFGVPEMPQAAPFGRRIITGEGSGFFISADGYAVTNYHVVDHAKSVEVTTQDGATYTAKVVGTDPKTDLALIKVDADKPFVFVRFADQPPRVGDWVVAVGNPFGLGGTVTAGIVSARGRDIGAGPYDDYIQIDAPINKGNSGGPAFNTNGEVIGVNTAIFSPSGGSVGIGFDIPADTAKMVVAQLKDNGYVMHGWIGVRIQSVTADIANSLGMKQAGGAIVDEPEAGSPAALAGIKSGDVITALNGTPVKDSRELARTIGMMAPKSSLALTILRNGQTKSVQLMLGEMPSERLAQAGKDGSASPTGGNLWLGLMLGPAGAVNSGTEGVVIMAVAPNGPAADHGLKPGDVILDVSGNRVSNANDVQKALAQARAQGKHDVLIRVKTADAIEFVALPIRPA